MKKGDLSIQVIIVAVIALIVLIVLSLIFTGKLGMFGGATEEPLKLKECPINQCKQYCGSGETELLAKTTCTEDPVRSRCCVSKE